MKIRILCLLLAIGWCTSAWGQATTPVGNPLKELRASLAPLNANRIPTGILMNRVMLFTDPTRFVGKGDTAASYKGFEQQYWEYYHASLDTAKLLPLDSLRAMTARYVQQQNALPLLMLSYTYNAFLPTAASDRLITIDSTNALVTDGPDFSRSPYSTEQLFSVALALPAAKGTVAIYVGPEFWLGNGPVPDVLYLDFDDGRGVRAVQMGSTVQITRGLISRSHASPRSTPHLAVVGARWRSYSGRVRWPRPGWRHAALAGSHGAEPADYGQP